MGYRMVVNIFKNSNQFQGKPKKPEFFYNGSYGRRGYKLRLFLVCLQRDNEKATSVSYKERVGTIFDENKN